MHLVLIGYRGSGKTTVGRMLAGRVGLPFVDADEHLVAAAGMTIREIFAAGGEADFRDRETRAIAELLQRPDHVIALGGGALLRAANRASLSTSNARVVYLRGDAVELHRRIVADPATAAARPALTHLGGGVQEVRHLLAGREPAYLAASSIVVDVAGRPVNDIVEAIFHRDAEGSKRSQH